MLLKLRSLHLLVLLLCLLPPHARAQAVETAAVTETHQAFYSEARSFNGEFADEFAKQSADDGLYFSPERSRLHEEILNQFLKEGQSNGYPKLIFLGGPSGSGKSTIINIFKNEKFLKLEQFLVIDPDKIKEHLPEYQALLKSNPNEAARVVHEESSYLAKVLFRAAINRDKNIVYDSTFSSLNAHTIHQMMEAGGGTVDYTRIWVSVTADPAVIDKRLADRAKATGRHIPTSVVQSIRKRSDDIAHRIQSNSAFFLMFDEIMRIDTSAEKPVVKGYSARHYMFHSPEEKKEINEPLDQFIKMLKGFDHPGWQITDFRSRKQLIDAIFNGESSNEIRTAPREPLPESALDRCIYYFKALKLR